MKKSIKAVLSVLLAAVLMSCTLLSAALAADTVKRMSCTMIKSGAASRGFCWYTLEKSASDLQIVEESKYDENFTSAATYTGTCSLYRGQYSHKVTVTDLKAGTLYFYRAGDASKGLWSETASFVTDDGDEKFSFITIADVQASSRENFEEAFITAESAYETMPDAGFMVNLGDYVNDNTNDEWDWYFDTFKGVNNRITQVPVAGNHDGNITNKLNTFCFQNTFCLDESRNQSLEGVYYSFDYGNAHFAVLNSNDMYPISQAQRNWLINDMSNTDAEWKIVFAHRSFYSAGKNINKPDTVIMRNVLLPIIDELGIDMVYAGHDHMYLRTFPLLGDEKTDTTYITEIYNGEETTFALNPEGTVYTLPSTTGTKRYNVNENAIEPILDVADKAFSTNDRGGCFCTTEIDGDKLIYKAYLVDDETGEKELVDTFAIKKTEKKECIEPTELDESFFESAYELPLNFVSAIKGMLISYIKLLLQVIFN